MTAETTRDWGKTLALPETAFPMRAGLPQLEPKLLERWQQTDLYKQLRDAAKGREKFILHDGPPYANGQIHIGHALNKILKDLVTKSQQMLGYDSNYVPGWDCHGLPIEWKIEEQYMKAGKAKPNLKDPVAMKAFRDECRAFAEHWKSVQSAEFQRLGVIGDWKNPYSTMTYPAEAQIARELHKFAETGQLYRGSKPVMWSVVEKTALAEAEVEYHDYQSDMVWVKFPVVRHEVGRERISGADTLGLQGSSIVIWTTTPWTLPGNRAISFNSKVDYGLYEVTAAPENNWAKVGDKFILADKLAAEVMKAAKIEADGFVKLATVSADDLAGIVCAHPLRFWTGGASSVPSPLVGEGQGGGEPRPLQSPPHPNPPPQGGRESVPTSIAGARGYQFDVPLLDGDHVTDDAGTGFVHTAPGHGREDFDIWTAKTRDLLARKIDPAIPYTVDENGAYTKDAPGFVGERVITDKGEKGKANDAVIKALADAGMMVARGRLKHQYPHSWRSKKPVIFRNTPQWFIHMDKKIAALGDLSLRDVSLRSIKETEWVPETGENRIRGMIEAKPDWVISRQRAWGVPIAVFVKKGTNDVLVDKKVNQRIYDAMYTEGADAWFSDTDGARFLKPEHDPKDFEKINDVLDVWFDSGSTHTYVLEDRDHFPGLYGIKRRVAGGKDRVMYLEGSDQHRGWFHSSLIESSGTRGHAPFDVVLTHGFILDEKGDEKMSKSKGNVITPQDVMKSSGADILRLWVASADTTGDIRFGPGIVNAASEAYRKTRNTIRWMLGTLAHFPRVASEGPGKRGPAGSRPDATIAYADLPELERYMLHHLAVLDGEIREAYRAYNYAKVVSALAQFMNTDLSAFYFDIRKDALYCEAPSNAKRRAALFTVEQIFRCTCVWLAPILSFTAEEAWLSRYGEGASSVHLERFPDTPTAWRDEALDAKWEKVRRVRRVITGALEVERANKSIGASLEAAPEVFIADADLMEAAKGIDMAEVAITSGCAVTAGSAPDGAFTTPDVAGVAVIAKRASGKKCARSWRYTNDVGSDPKYPELSARDAAVMREIEG